MQNYKMYIDGEWCEGAAKEVMNNQNPASGETFATVCQANESDVNRAIEAAYRSSKAWGKCW